MNDWDSSQIAPRVRVMQIIAFAMIFGVAVFLGIVCLQVFGQRGGQPLRPSDQLSILALAATATFAGGAVLSFALPAALMRGTIRRLAQSPAPKNDADDYSMLIGMKQTAFIISLALLEGPAFFACIALMVEGETFLLGVVAAAIVLMLVRVPTVNGVRAWISDQKKQLDLLREGGYAPTRPK